MTLDEIMADMAAGTPGPWELVWWGNEHYPYPLTVLGDGRETWVARDGTTSSPANARRISRVPAMEALILAQAARIAELEAAATIDADSLIALNNLIANAVDQFDQTGILALAPLSAAFMRLVDARAALRGTP